MDDDDLERALRAGLERRGERAVVDRGLVGRARADARGRRTTRWAVLGAAAAVAAVVGVVAVSVPGADAPPSADETGPATDATTTSASGAPVVDPTRTEQWRGVEVSVPPDWALGNTGDCGDLPVGEPYVGRPIGVTDACGISEPDRTPTAPYVWFDAPGVDVGTDDLGGGWTRETVEVAGVRVSVADDDPGRRQALLDGVRPAGGPCAASLDDVPRPRFEWTTEGGGELTSSHLCAYRERDGELALVTAAELPPSAYEDAARAVGRTGEPEACTRPTFEVVVVTGVYRDPYGPDPLTRDLVYDLGCSTVRERGVDLPGPLRAHAVTPRNLWSGGPDFRRLLTGPFESWGYARFIGVQG
jgi:hypothetical protein